MIETTAKTVDEAIELALRELNAERAEVEIDVLSRGKSGILGLGGEPAKVRVTKLDSANEVITIASEILDRLLLLTGVEAQAVLKQAQSEDAGGPVFNVDGDDSGLLIGRKGETLRSLQFMVNFLTSVRTDERPNIVVDVAGYQERRNRSLTALARNVAQRVANTGRSVTLEPMAPNERRIVHLALAENSNVVTESTGVGPSRQVVVRPKHEGQRAPSGRPPRYSGRKREDEPGSLDTPEE
ncbi:MAG: protein jag [Chloroflexi bacterium]|nr:protein jag [Chloroflexota bacterium]